MLRHSTDSSINQQTATEFWPSASAVGHVGTVYGEFKDSKCPLRNDVRTLTSFRGAYRAG